MNNAPLLRHEQRKVDQLLSQLAKKKPESVKAAPISYGQVTVRTSTSAHPRVFFST
jgi:hypothetical protein